MLLLLPMRMPQHACMRGSLLMPTRNTVTSFDCLRCLMKQSTSSGICPRTATRVPSKSPSPTPKDQLLFRGSVTYKCPRIKVHDPTVVLCSPLSLEVLPDDEHYLSRPLALEELALVSFKILRLPLAADVCGCFSALSTVQLEDGSMIAMKDLAIGRQCARWKGQVPTCLCF